MPESPGTASYSTQGLLERLPSPWSSCSVVKAHIHLKTDPFQSEIYNPFASLQYPSMLQHFYFLFIPGISEVWPV